MAKPFEPIVSGEGAPNNLHFMQINIYIQHKHKITNAIRRLNSVEQSFAFNSINLRGKSSKAIQWFNHIRLLLSNSVDTSQCSLIYFRYKKC